MAQIGEMERRSAEVVPTPCGPGTDTIVTTPGPATWTVQLLEQPHCGICRNSVVSRHCGCLATVSKLCQGTARLAGRTGRHPPHRHRYGALDAPNQRTSGSLGRYDGRVGVLVKGVRGALVGTERRGEDLWMELVRQA